MARADQFSMRAIFSSRVPSAPPAGKWWYRFNGTGALVAANEAAFTASPTVFG